MANNRSLKTAQDFLYWIRKLICVHGPIGHAVCPLGSNPYAFDFCKRCMKVMCYYRHD